MVSVCFAGVTGWTAPPIVAAIDEADDLRLSSGVSRSAAGQSLATAAGSASHGSVYATVAEALESAQVDVLIDLHQRGRCQEQRVERGRGRGARGDWLQRTDLAGL